MIIHKSFSWSHRRLSGSGSYWSEPEIKSDLWKMLLKFPVNTGICFVPKPDYPPPSSDHSRAWRLGKVLPCDFQRWLENLEQFILQEDAFPSLGEGKSQRFPFKYKYWNLFSENQFPVGEWEWHLSSCVRLIFTSHLWVPEVDLS